MTIRVGFQKDGITPEDLRLTASVFTPPAAALTATSGLTSTGGALTSTGAMTATIGTFRAIIQGTSSSLQGAYPFVLDATTSNLTFSDGHATLPRIDLVYAQVRDNPYDSSGFQDGRIAILNGTANASPVAPAVPANAIPLWEVRVNAGVNAGNGGINFGSLTTDRRTYVGWQQLNIPALAASTLGAFTDWTPTWTASAGTPAINNGYMYGAYCRVGRLITGYVKMKFGSTTAYGTSGSGQWRWSLPVAARTFVDSDDVAAGTASGFRPGTALYTGVLMLSHASQFFYIGKDAGALAWGNINNVPYPAAPATNDLLTFRFSYEAAS